MYQAMVWMPQFDEPFGDVDVMPQCDIMRNHVGKVQVAHGRWRESLAWHDSLARYDMRFWFFSSCCTAALRYNSPSNRCQSVSWQCDETRNRENKPFLIWRPNLSAALVRYDMRKAHDYALRTAPMCTQHVGIIHFAISYRVHGNHSFVIGQPDQPWSVDTASSTCSRTVSLPK